MTRLHQGLGWLLAAELGPFGGSSATRESCCFGSAWLEGGLEEEAARPRAQ